MPRGDRTGPAGMGSMTGRRMGFCAGFNVPGYMNSGLGGRFARGRGQGRGWYFRPFPEVKITPDQERQMLEQELKELKEETKEIEKRLESLSKE